MAAIRGEDELIARGRHVDAPAQIDQVDVERAREGGASGDQDLVILAARRRAANFRSERGLGTERHVAAELDRGRAVAGQERSFEAHCACARERSGAGDVAEEMILFFNGAATGMSLDYVVSDRRMRDRLAADTVGIKIVPCVDLTGYDNQ